jgi:hypothetical protein
MTDSFFLSHPMTSTRNRKELYPIVTVNQKAVVTPLSLVLEEESKWRHSKGFLPLASSHDLSSGWMCEGRCGALIPITTQLSWRTHPTLVYHLMTSSTVIRQDIWEEALSNLFSWCFEFENTLRTSSGYRNHRFMDPRSDPEPVPWIVGHSELECPCYGTNEGTHVLSKVM